MLDAPIRRNIGIKYSENEEYYGIDLCDYL